MIPKTAYLRLIAFCAFADADLIREELAGIDLTPYDCALDLAPRALPHSSDSLSRYGVPLYPSQIKNIVPQIQTIASAHGIELRWGPRLAILLKEHHEKE